MTHTFDAQIVTAVLHHMNTDHADDNVLIARAFGGESDAVAVSSAVMTGLDGTGGTWTVTVNGEERELNVPWPAGEITERAEVRREVVALYDAACAALGVEPRPH